MHYNRIQSKKGIESKFQDNYLGFYINNKTLRIVITEATLLVLFMCNWGHNCIHRFLIKFCDETLYSNRLEIITIFWGKTLYEVVILLEYDVSNRFMLLFLMIRFSRYHNSTISKQLILFIEFRNSTVSRELIIWFICESIDWIFKKWVDAKEPYSY